MYAIECADSDDRFTKRGQLINISVNLHIEMQIIKYLRTSN